VKNPKEIQQGTAKPILVQKGPYVYTLVCYEDLDRLEELFFRFLSFSFSKN